jgi:hypothetical protein
MNNRDLFGGRCWLKKNDADKDPTLGELAAADIRNAEVFKKYGFIYGLFQAICPIN